MVDEGTGQDLFMGMRRDTGGGADQIQPTSDSLSSGSDARQGSAQDSRDSSGSEIKVQEKTSATAGGGGGLFAALQQELRRRPSAAVAGDMT